jgi:hypothetical protein
MAIAKPAYWADDYRESAKTQLRLNSPSSLALLRTILVVVCAIGVTGCARNPVQRELEVRKPPQRVVRVARAPARVRVHSEGQQSRSSRAAAQLPGRAGVDVPEESQQAELRARRPDPALLVPQPAPNCEFKRADIKAVVDPEEWALLRVEYERQCYQDAEKAARERLKQLQGYLRD